MTIQPINPPIDMIVDTRAPVDQWVVFEHQAKLTADPNEPPTVILIDACRLIDVFKLHSGKVNSEWIKMFAGGGQVLVRIIAMAPDKLTAKREARRLMLEKAPICNVRGHDARRNARVILCLNNGKRYSSQTEAARDLNISGSGISRHLMGELAHVSNYVFKYDVG